VKSGRRRLAIGGILDRYVLRSFFAAYLVALLSVVGLFLVVDLASNLEDYLRPSASGTSASSLVARYYLLQLPFMYLTVAPFVTLLAALFTVARLQRTREVVATLASGVSARRLLLPIFVGAGLIGLLTAFVREAASEGLGAERSALRHRLDKHEDALVLEPVRFKDTAGEMIHLARFRPGADLDPTAVGASTFDGLDAIRLIDGVWFHFSVDRGTWVQPSHGEAARAGHWVLEGGRLDEVGSDGRTRQVLEELDSRLAFAPNDVLSAWRARDDPLELSLGEARSLAARDPGNVQYQTLFNYLVTFPLANLVLLLVGLPYLLQFERGRGSERVVAGFLLCVFYFATDFVCLNLGMQGQLDPVMASWLPPLLFGSLGTVLFATVRT
jgi:lipopolysaccharide export system permease protein